MFIAEQKRRMLKFAKTSAFAFLFFYFTFHVISGDKGVLALMKLEQKVETLKQEEAAIIERRETLEDKVSRLYKQSLDLDLLEERARHQLGVKASNEIIYFRETGSEI